MRRRAEQHAGALLDDACCKQYHFIRSLRSFFTLEEQEQEGRAFWTWRSSGEEHERGVGMELDGTASLELSTCERLLRHGPEPSRSHSEGPA